MPIYRRSMNAARCRIPPFDNGKEIGPGETVEAPGWAGLENAAGWERVSDETPAPVTYEKTGTGSVTATFPVPLSDTTYATEEK